MDYYKLQNDEVVLYHGPISLITSDKQRGNCEREILLTNLNFVIVSKTKQLLKKERVDVEVYDAKTIKFYRDRPHIIQKKTIVELYFIETEKFIEFPNKKEAGIFCDNALRVTSGKSKLVRGVQKVKKEIAETNEALDIDIVQIAATTARVALGVAANVGSYEDAGKKTKFIGRIAQSLTGKGKEKQPAITSKSDVDKQE